jgi:hypothetical protein
MLTALDVLGLLIVAIATVLLYLIYAVNRPDPDRAANKEAERADRVARDLRALEENEKKRLFTLEMAKLGYVESSVIKSERSEEREGIHGISVLTDKTCDWQLAWVLDGPKAKEPLEHDQNWNL